MMQRPDLLITDLPAQADDAALDLLDLSMAEDALLNWVIGPSPRIPQRRRDYLAHYLAFHRRSGFPILACQHSEYGLVGVSLFCPAADEADSAQLSALGRAIAESCGADALARLDSLLERAESQSPGTARLEFIAIAPDHQGKGFGSALLSATLAQCASEAVTLETGDTRLLSLYQGHGFTLEDQLPMNGFTWHLLQRPALTGTPSGASNS